MKSIFAPLAAAAAVIAVAAPAAAQPYGHDRWDRGDYNLNQRQERLAFRIDRGLRDGSLTRGEAARLQSEARRIDRLAARYRIDGLNGWERADLDRRFDRLDAQIRFERHDREYGYGYGGPPIRR